VEILEYFFSNFKMNNLNSVQFLNTFEYMDIDINEGYDDAFPCDDDITFEYDYRAMLKPHI